MSASDHLSPQQFWDAEEEPGVGYHVSSESNRTSIEKRGLLPGKANDTWHPGVYVHRSLAGVTSYQQHGDLYRVNTEGLHLEPDEWIPHLSSRSSTPIPPERVKRVGRRVQEGVLFDTGEGPRI